MTADNNGPAIRSFKVRRQHAWKSSSAGWFVCPPQWILLLLRTCLPIPRLFGWAAVTRYDDVAEVLNRHDVFMVPFGDEIARLNDGQTPGTPFILGIDDPKKHDDQLKLVMRAFKREDVDAIVTPRSRCVAEEIVAASNGRMDAIPELITRVPLDLCVEYYGVEIPGEPQDFADATIAVSAHLFGPPPIKAGPLDPPEPADEGAAYVRGVVDCAINGKIRPDSVLARLKGMQIAREHVRAFLIGMITGFVPTNTMAGGHILEMLLRKPAFMKEARKAALAGDDDLLKHCLFEAMRFMPLNPGPFRICARDHVVAADTRRAAKIKKGTKVLASTMSAMFDSRQVDKPGEFNPGRPASDYMLFGYGMHWCVGAFIAQAQITQTFKALLLQPNLKRARKGGKLQLRGGFPEHLFVEFDPVKRQ